MSKKIKRGMVIHMDAQIKKGVLEMCILYKLSQKDYYGYPLMQEMKIIFPEVNDSTFYAILRRLNKEKAADIYFGNESGGPQRKYYKITEEGINRLEKSINDWKQLKLNVSEIGIE